MKQETIKKTVLKGIKAVVEPEVKRVESDWPPRCGMFIHQPKRPTKKQ